MEYNQLKKRNSFMEFLATFSQDYTIPTHNVNLINVHEKTLSLESRIDSLQKNSKEILLKNL